MTPLKMMLHFIYIDIWRTLFPKATYCTVAYIQAIYYQHVCSLKPMTIALLTQSATYWDMGTFLYNITDFNQHFIPK